MKYFSHYSLPYRIISDGAGCFRGRFQEFLKGLHIDMHHASAYISPSNGNFERAISQVRTAIERINSLNDSVLMKGWIWITNIKILQQGS